MSSPPIDESEESDDLWREMILRETKMKAAYLGMTIAEYEEAGHVAAVLAESAITAAAGSAEGQLPHSTKSSAAEEKEGGEAQSEEEEEYKDDDEEEGEEHGGGEDYEVTMEALNELELSTTVDPNADIIWMILPADVVWYVWTFMDSIDMAGHMHRVCRRAGRASTGGLFHVNEKIYMYLCQQIFPKQFHNQRKKKLRLLRYPSWKHMAILRPRIRTNGFYSLRTQFTKPPCNDMFWEEKRTKSVESNFFRHMRFYDNGNILYSLSITDPWDTPFKSMQPVDKKIFVGRYHAMGNKIEIEVQTHYCVICFSLEILDGSASYSQYKGKHSVLRILSHRQIVVGGDITEFTLPVNCDMRFYRHWKWTPDTFLR